MQSSGTSTRRNLRLTVRGVDQPSPDTPAEIELLKRKMAHHEAPIVVAKHWAQGAAVPKRSRARWWT